jgi:hypothetical protein
MPLKIVENPPLIRSTGNWHIKENFFTAEAQREVAEDAER